MEDLNKIPVFETKRLLLREVKLSDSDSYQKNFVDYNVIRYLSSLVPWPYPENGVYEFIKNEIIPNQGIDRWMWGIFIKDKPNELIGCIDLWKSGKPEHRGFWLARKHWNKGFMTEATHPILDYAFNSLGFKELIFANALGNIASRRIKEKTGCEFIKTTPAKYVDPEFTEQELWRLTREQWVLNNKGVN